MTIAGLVADHLWQSTLAAGAIAAFVWLFRRNHAGVRYGLWLAASLQFFVPFSVLGALGGHMYGGRAPVTPPALTGLVERVAQPFAGPLDGAPATMDTMPAAADPAGAWLTLAVAIWLLGATAVLLTWLASWWRISRLARRSPRIVDGPVHAALRRLERQAGLAREITIAASDRSIEPGVFAIWRPVLLWPVSIDAHLDAAQIEAVLAHEVVHVKRRDNLTAALHMLVQAVCWFHPLVWWLGARLVEERERACDEEVIRLGAAPDVYAESVLKTCSLYVKSPLTCMAGVTGHQLRRRIESIMTNEGHARLGVTKRVLLAAAALAATIAPVALGVLTGPRVLAQVVAPGADAPVFDAVSVRPSEANTPTSGRGTPGRFTGSNLSVRRMIRQAYDIHDSQIVGGPDWLSSQGYDIAATAGDRPPDQMRLMMQTLLRDRFRLAFHAETRDLPVFALVVARSDRQLGPGLRRTSEGECPPAGAGRTAPRAGGPPPPAPSPFDPDARLGCGQMIFGPGRLLAHGVPIDMLTRSLANLPAITSFNRVVQNQTALDGTYDFDLKWTNEPGPGRGAPAGGPGPSPVPIPSPSPGDEPALVTALQEQLGLRLDARQARVDVMVIDAVEPPTPD